MRLKIRQMIKLMSLGFIGLALLSCSKGDSEPEYQKPIEFSSYTGRSVTKAGDSFVTGVELPANQSFGVYAYNTGTSEDFVPASISSYGKFMTNVEVTYSGGGASDAEKYPYAYRYWPNSETSNRLAFFAYYPYGTETGITPNGFADFGFTVQDDPANQVDFMLSDVVPNQMYSSTNSTTGVVKLTFNHMLTQVRFKGITDAPEGVTVKITSLNVIDVINKGTLTPVMTVPLVSDPEAEQPNWTPYEDPETQVVSVATYPLDLLDVALPTTAKEPAEDPIAIASPSQTLLMIPQTLSDDARLKIDYSITTTTPARTIHRSSVVSLKPALEEWKRNQQIVYTLTVGLNPIEFSAKVVDWTSDEYFVIVE